MPVLAPMKKRRRSDPQPRPQRQLDRFGEMLQEAAGVIRGLRPGIIRHDVAGVVFDFDDLDGLGIDGPMVNIAELFLPYRGTEKQFGPVTMTIPAELSWTDDVNDKRALVTFSEPIRAKFQRWIKWPFSILTFMDRPQAFEVGVKAAGILRPSIVFHKDWSFPQ